MIGSEPPWHQHRGQRMIGSEPRGVSGEAKASFFDDCAGLWVVRKSAAPAEDTTATGSTNQNWEATNPNDVDVMHRVHRICRVCEHRCVGAAWAAGLTPRAFFDPQKNLLAQS